MYIKLNCMSPIGTLILQNSMAKITKIIEVPKSLLVFGKKNIIKQCSLTSLFCQNLNPLP